jgi:hypothetical protein
MTIFQWLTLAFATESASPVGRTAPSPRSAPKAALGDAPPSKTKPNQAESNLAKCISLHFLWRIGTFQWVTSESASLAKKNFPSPDLRLGSPLASQTPGPIWRSGQRAGLSRHSGSSPHGLAVDFGKENYGAIFSFSQEIVRRLWRWLWGRVGRRSAFRVSPSWLGLSRPSTRTSSSPNKTLKYR